MKTKLLAIIFLGSLFACGEAIVPRDANQDDNTSDDNSKDDGLTFGDTESVHVGADGEKHYYPKEQSIDVDFVTMSLIDDPIDDVDVGGDDDATDVADDDAADEADANEDPEDGKDAKKCGDWIGEGVKLTKVTGSKHDIQFEPNSVLALFITGNQNQVSISLSLNKDEEPAAEADPADTDPVGEDGGEEEDQAEAPPAEPVPTFDGVCLIMAGNNAKVNLDVDGFEIGHLALIGRGNGPLVNLNMDERANVKNSTIDIRGNGGSLVIDKEGDYDCPEATLKGNNTTVTCN